MKHQPNYISNKEVRNRQIHLLKKIITILDKNNLEYFAYYGTLLGSVRHRGFIPWDDDIDLAMFRKDFQKLSNIDWENYGMNLFSCNSSKNFPHSFVKLSDNKTILHEDSNWDSTEVGINIDVFPLDTINSKNISFKIISHLLYVLKNMNSLLLIKPNSKHSFYKRTILRFISIVPTMFARYCSLCINFIIDKILTNDRVDIAASLAGVYKDELYELALFQSSKKAEFENMQLNIPIGSHHILKKLYGDYMTMPPPHKRTTHHRAKYSLR